MTATPALKPCEACGKPADDPVIKGLCGDCAARIDRDTDERAELYLLHPYGWDW
jgi:NMD protein affecting ribosome stability and mRNA decay